MEVCEFKKLRSRSPRRQNQMWQVRNDRPKGPGGPRRNEQEKQRNGR